MKIIFCIFAFTLPLHALIITIMKCKYNINTNIIRFWKEFIVLFLLFTWIYWLLKRYKFNIPKIFDNNYILWFSVAFVLSSTLYMFFPHFSIETHNLLGFKYDVFFIFTLIAWFSLISARNSINFILKNIFISTWLILIIFLPWYIFWDISNTVNIFWYSSNVSTYIPNSCISFSQNVNGVHRFQATFWWPIRFSVFLTIFWFLYIWFILDNIKKIKHKILLIIIPSIFVLSSIFFSYSKTSIFWLLVWIFLFFYMINKTKIKKVKIPKIIPYLILFITLIITYIKRDLFIHLWSIINRFDNLIIAVKKFLFNPLWQGVWKAWPATQIWWSENFVWWEISSRSVEVYKYLPENWYIQILLEQSILWFLLFIWLLIFIWIWLYKIALKKKNFLSIWLFTSFITICFMWNFTHVFEEAASSYLLFLIIWAYLWKYYSIIKD